jgi:hypothetical protein
MSSLDNFISRIEKTCGEEKSIIVTFKYSKKAEIIQKILERAKLTKSLAGIIYEVIYKGKTFRLYSSGKAIFRGMKEKQVLLEVLTELIL